MRYVLLLLCFALCGCLTQGERKGAETLRNIEAVTQAHVENPNAVGAEESLKVIGKAASAAAALIDPKGEAPGTVSVADIVTNKKEAFKRIVIDASKVEPTDWRWLATLGGGLLVAVGFAGKLLGPPWNIAGSLAEGLGRRLVPKYEETKQAAIGGIVALETVLTNYSDLLDAMPELKAALALKVGKDPIDWFKDQLQKAHTDQGTQGAVGSLMALMKRELPTEAGVIKPSVSELDSFLAKHLSNLK
jgi:hypothetical protein